MPSEFYDDNKFYKKSSVSFHFNFFNLQKIRNPGKNFVKKLSKLIIDFAKLNSRKARNGDINIKDFNSRTWKPFLIIIFLNLALSNLFICSCL